MAEEVLGFGMPISSEESKSVQDGFVSSLKSSSHNVKSGDLDAGMHVEINRKRCALVHDVRACRSVLCRMYAGTAVSFSLRRVDVLSSTM